MVSKPSDSKPSDSPRRDVVITGIGLVSAQGEGHEVHLAALRERKSAPRDETSFAPHAVHPVAPLELDRQIPKKSDQRQMEPWQRLGVYAAGLALDDAGLKGNADALAKLHLLVAAGGGERDYAVDGQILTAMPQADDAQVLLNQRLMSDLRPTLFLAQLSNLLAGNISIVHGITGPSRTFMGEEQCGIDALRIAQARIASGQADTVLVGGAYNAERPDVLLIFEMGQVLAHAPWRPVLERDGTGGLVPGSAAAFLVLESAEAAAARGATAIARLAPVEVRRTRRGDGALEHAVSGMWRAAGAAADALVVSGATGIAALTKAEIAGLDTAGGSGARVMLGDLIGHALEAQAPFGAGLAALALRDGLAPEAVVTIVGHQRGEGLARLLPAHA
jgi:3-oxoacyl-[acyl-carrier-protein] synthase II